MATVIQFPNVGEPRTWLEAAHKGAIERFIDWQMPRSEARAAADRIVERLRPYLEPYGEPVVGLADPPEQISPAMLKYIEHVVSKTATQATSNSAYRAYLRFPADGIGFVARAQGTAR